MNIVFKLILIQLIFAMSTFAGNLPLEKISLQLHWKHQFEFAGYYMAKEKGFYQDVDLDVNILEYENGVEPSKSVTQNEHAFAVGYSSVILDETNTNEMVLLSAIFQSSPHVLVSLRSSGIKSIKDFKNKKIMIDPEATKSAAFISMLRANGVSFDDMTIQEPTFKVDALINATTDLDALYYSNETYSLDKKGIAYDVWNPKDYGFDFYSDLLFTSKKELKAHPETVENFRAASLKGWEYAFDHIDETVAVILKKYNAQAKSEGELVYEANILKKLAYTTGNDLGTIEKTKIQRLMDIYNVLGVYKNKINLDEFIYKIPNNFFLNQKEKDYLINKKVINMCVDPDWMPFEKLENKKHIGIAADIFKIIKKSTDIDIKLMKTRTWTESLEFAQQRKCDILSLIMSTTERKKYLNFTTPYLKIPIVMATKLDVAFVNDFHSLKGKKLGITKGYAFAEILKTSFPDLTIVDVQNINDGLTKVVQGDLYGYVGTLASIGYAFQTKFTGELKIAGKFDGTWDLSVGVRNDDDVLLGILQKAINDIDKNVQQQVLNNWLAINYVKGVDYTLLLQTIGAFTLVLLIVLFFYMKQLKLQKQLELLASTDPLTKLYNRRYFSDMSEHIFDLAKRNKTDLSLIMLDIDDFKAINDAYGHKVGDDVIVSIAKLLQTFSRKSDIACRFGGEEFILLLPETCLSGAAVIAEKIRTQIQNSAIKLNTSKDIKFTSSFGIAEVDAFNDKNIETVINRADDALYEAKESGKNKVCVYKDKHAN